jgi:hypothetical protein
MDYQLQLLRLPHIFAPKHKFDVSSWPPPFVLPPASIAIKKSFVSSN